MARFGTRLLLACLLIGFGVFFGVNMVKNGIEQVNGPLPLMATKEEVPKVQPPEKIQPAEKQPDPTPEIVEKPLHPVQPIKQSIVCLIQQARSSGPHCKVAWSSSSHFSRE